MENKQFPRLNLPLWIWGLHIGSVGTSPVSPDPPVTTQRIIYSYLCCNTVFAGKPSFGYLNVTNFKQNSDSRSCKMLSLTWLLLLTVTHSHWTRMDRNLNLWPLIVYSLSLNGFLQLKGLYMHTSMHVYIHTHKNTNTHAHIHIQTHIHTHEYTHTYTYIDTHMYTHF